MSCNLALCLYELIELLNGGAFFRSEASGNCLYSFVSLILARDNSLVPILRKLVKLNCL